jgi:ATP-dependent Clp protease ATP-binding subunit ClpC
MQILCRFTRRNAVLVGEPGVGKKAIIRGSAQRIVAGDVPSDLAEKSILVLDLTSIAHEKDRSLLDRLRSSSSTTTERPPIFVVDELHTPGSTVSGATWVQMELILKWPVLNGRIQCISTATPAGYAKAVESHTWLERHFQVVQVKPAGEADAIKVLLGIKGPYEKFHGVTYTEDALTNAVHCASSHIGGRNLPGKAVDLMDEAGAFVKLRQGALPQEFVEVQKRLRFIVKHLENAIAITSFKKPASIRMKSARNAKT